MRTGYSRHQIVAILFSTVVLALVGAVFFGRMSIPEPIEQALTEQPASIPSSDEPVSGLITTSTESTTGSWQNIARLWEIADAAQYTQDEIQNITVYELANEAVVNITTETVGVNWFLEPVPQEGGSGSGSIIDNRGYVVTNTHVIDKAVKIFISLADGSQFEGRVVGTDRENDIAVIKFDPPSGVQLRTIAFGDSSGLKVGQKVLAIGNPFGLERTLTTGIVSALGRPVQSGRNIIIRDMIQTDTAINPGNSGGPLLDTRGRMIGINTMIYSTSGSSAGIGFAVPVNTAKRVVSEIIQHGRVLRGSIDAELVQLNTSISNYAKLPVSRGLLVSRVGRGSNAERAGLRGGSDAVRYGSSRNSQIIYLGGDIITAIAGQPVQTLAEYYAALEPRKPGEEIEITIIRGRQQINLKMTLAERTY